MSATQLDRLLLCEDEQLRFGARLALACVEPLLIFLRGDLGVGKTTLTRGLLRGLGYQGPVKSPTYTLIESYDIGGRRVYHLDLYRVVDAQELEYLGLREMLGESALMLVEWPERGEAWLPAADLLVEIAHRESGRSLRLQGFGSRGARAMRLIG